jgi:pimeloyl-ACP methyl ester carboxylesterase
MTASLDLHLTRDKLHIGGAWVAPAASGTIVVQNPATEEIIGQVPEGTAADVDAAVAAARAVHAPVLLVHGAEDRETRPVHSERVFAALAGPKRLLVVPGAGHGDALGNAWGQVRAWIRAGAAP